MRSFASRQRARSEDSRKYSFFFPSFFANGHENDRLMATKEKVSIATPESSSTMSKKKERNKIFYLTQRQKRCSFVLVWLEYRLSIGILQKRCFGTKVTRRKMTAFVTEGTPDARKNGDSMKYVSTVLSSLTGEGEFSRDRSRIFQS